MVHPAVTAINDVVTSFPSEYFGVLPVIKLTSPEVSVGTRVLIFRVVVYRSVVGIIEVIRHNASEAEQMSYASACCRHGSWLRLYEQCLQRRWYNQSRLLSNTIQH